MDNTWFIYYLLLMLIILYLPWKRRKRYAAKRIMKKGKINNSQRSAGKIMRELAERFIGKDVYINLLDGRADGVIKEGIIELVYIVLQSVVKPGITGFFKIDLHIKCYIYLS